MSAPTPRDPVLDAIDEILIKDNENQPNRDYIGASIVGEPCSRKVWIKYNTHHKEKMSAESVRRINDGHRCEAVMSSLLKRVPNVELITHDEANQQYGFKNGILRGHYDGVINGIRGLSTWAIWEHKATNEKNFNKLVKLASNLEHMALQQWNPVYYAQAVVNMHHEKLDYHYMTVSTAGLRDYTSVLTEANPTFAEGLITKANRLATMKEPPQKIGGKDYFGCKMCCFYEVCHA